MRTQFRDRLMLWQSTSEYGETRKVRYGKVPQGDGTEEFIIELRISVLVRVGHLSRNISEEIRFCTQAQSKSSLNKHEGDMFIFEGVAKILIDKFYNAFNKTVDEFMQEITPDGFLDLK